MLIQVRNPLLIRNYYPIQNRSRSGTQNLYAILNNHSNCSPINDYLLTSDYNNSKFSFDYLSSLPSHNEHLPYWNNIIHFILSPQSYIVPHFLHWCRQICLACVIIFNDSCRFTYILKQTINFISW